MSQKPVLVIMAAGMGSRYGGLKQIDPVDREGDLIIDFSIFDAVEAGFEKVVFIIKKSIEKEFKEHIGNRMEKHVQVEYVYQENDRLPDGFEVPEGRVKPWGTGHAILCCSEVIDGPFAVINADDYYGKSAFFSFLFSASRTMRAASWLTSCWRLNVAARSLSPFLKASCAFRAALPSAARNVLALALPILVLSTSVMAVCLAAAR